MGDENFEMSNQSQRTGKGDEAGGGHEGHDGSLSTSLLNMSLDKDMTMDEMGLSLSDKSVLAKQLSSDVMQSLGGGGRGRKKRHAFGEREDGGIEDEVEDSADGLITKKTGEGGGETSTNNNVSNVDVSKDDKVEKNNVIDADKINEYVSANNSQICSPQVEEKTATSGKTNSNNYSNSNSNSSSSKGKGSNHKNSASLTPTRIDTTTGGKTDPDLLDADQSVDLSSDLAQFIGSPNLMWSLGSSGNGSKELEHSPQKKLVE